MQLTRPSVFILGDTKVNYEGVQEYLDHIGASDWDTDSTSDAEGLIEIMGRSCYRSFDVGLNPNIEKVREGNLKYLDNIIKVKHGSVLEHATVNFMFCDVSRVFTHELVRHRQGVAISQESLRFVRLTDLKFWYPKVILESKTAMLLFEDAIERAEDFQKMLTDELITENMSFSEKKLITSAMRRIAPMGLATNIGWTANFRTIRWLMELRTHESAEEEIRQVFGLVGEMMIDRYPAIFGDFEVAMSDGLPVFTTPNSKV